MKQYARLARPKGGTDCRTREVTVLDAFIIEEIIRREEHSERQRPSLRAPSRSPYEPPPSAPERDEDEEDPDHDGIIIIDI